MNGSHEMLRHAAIALTLLSVACRSQTGGVEESANQRDTSGRVLAELSLSYAADADKKSDQSIAAAQRLVRSQPGAASSYLELSRAFLAAKRERGEPVLLAFAADALAAAETIEPNASAALALRGVLLQEDHNFAELAVLATKLVAIDPTDSTGYLLLGDAKLELGDYDGATAAYEDAMERLPDLRVYARGAHIRWLHGDIDGALEMMNAALESSGKNREHLAWCLTDVGQLFLNRGELERALAAADRADALVADYPAASALRARAELAAGRLEAAAVAIRKVLATRASATDYFLLAEIDEARGDAQASAEAAKAGLALAAHDPLPAATYLARHDKDIARAVALTEGEVSARPTVTAHAASALALVRAGRNDEAAAAIDAALRLGTPLAELHLTGGLIKLARGDVAGAKSELDRAESINPLGDPLLRDELASKLEALR